MPFTFAHPAIVLPIDRLLQKRLSLSALVMGSMVPDFEGFILLTDVKTWSHTWHGMFWLDMPLGFALLFLFHGVVRDRLIDNLPMFFKKRFIGYKRLDWNKYFREHFLIVLLSMFIGVFSHMVWDDFTHLDTFFVQHFSFLRSWHYIGSKPYPVYKILQFGTSIIGAIVVALGIALMPVQQKVHRQSKSVYWAIVFCMAASFTAFRFLFDLEIMDTSLILITTLSGGLLGIVMASMLTKDIRGPISRN
jgi:hypothetical protein